MFSYFAYGLGIHSQLPIPEFIPAQVGCDVTLYIERDGKPSDYVPKEAIKKRVLFKLTREKAIIYLKEVGVFLVQGGNKIVFIPEPDVSEELIRLYLVGNIMAIVLYQRGLLALHASAVKINGGVVAFLGRSGQGKSSIAAALHAYGYQIINDDVAPVTLNGGPATITPGFPQIKLSRETSAAVGYDFESLHLLHRFHEKRGYCPTGDFPQAPLPIQRIYVLAYDTQFRIEPLRPAEAVIQLSRHAHPGKLFRSRDTSHFLQCATLAQKCPLYRLKRPRDLTLLPEAIKLIEKHVNDNLQLAAV